MSGADAYLLQAAVRDLRYTGTPVSLCYRDTGTGPPVIMLHGTTASLGVWEPIAARTSRRARVVAVDQRGHGRSDKPIDGYAASDYCDDLLALVTELGCAPAIVVGHSLGARNAVVFAAAHPSLVLGVVAVDYTPGIEPEVLDELEARVRGGDRIFGGRSEIADYVRQRYPLISFDAVQRRVDYGYHRSGEVYLPWADPSAMVQTVEGLRTDFADAFQQVHVPMTVLRGERSRLVSDAAFRRATAARPDIRAVVVPGADHYIPEVAPAPVHAEVDRMLDELA